MQSGKTDYLNPGIPRGLKRQAIPTVVATAESLRGYGHLVGSDYESYPVKIVRWPAQGWRPVDEDCGDEGGTNEGVFHSYWKGDVLYGRNEAVSGHYVLGYSVEPNDADEAHDRQPDRGADVAVTDRC